MYSGVLGVKKKGERCARCRTVGEPCASACVAAELLSPLLVAALWGCTNPLLKRGAQGVEKVAETNRVSQLLAEVRFLFLNFKVELETRLASSCYPVVYFHQTLHLLINLRTPLSLSQYLIPFLLNQSGSLVYYYTLSTTGERHQ